MVLVGKDDRCTSIEVDHRDVAASSHATGFPHWTLDEPGRNRTNQRILCALRPLLPSPPLSSSPGHVALSIEILCYGWTSQELAARIDKWGLRTCLFVSSVVKMQEV